mmetsp:Transcript_15828/g.32745  ORF Transcript_15828/g.32745 Transcript_15828/m.32745 type:complete len:241 (+) Transcript_15828:167-889(+)
MEIQVPSQSTWCFPYHAGFPILNSRKHGPIQSAIQQEQSNGKTRPNTNKVHFGIGRSQTWCHLFQSQNDPRHTSERNIQQCLPFHGHAHNENGKSRSHHSDRLNHETKITCHGRGNAQGQGHDGKGHGTTAFTGGTGHHAAKDHGDGHVIPGFVVGSQRFGKQVKRILGHHDTPPHNVNDNGGDAHGQEFAMSYVKGYGLIILIILNLFGGLIQLLTLPKIFGQGLFRLTPTGQGIFFFQ